MVTVIVAQGEEAGRGAMRLTLSEAGYVVIEAETGLAALTEMAAGTGPFVAVVDARLPDLDGAEVAHFAHRALRADRHLAVVLVTADVHPAPAREQMAAKDTEVMKDTEDADRFARILNRPFTPRDLVGAVRAAEWAMFAGQPEYVEAISHG